MPHSQKLTRREEFTRVMRHGQAYSDSLLLLRAAPNQLQTSRFGFSVGKQVGKAVTRNLVRRRLRAVVWQIRIQEGWDVVISARKAAATATFRALRESLHHLTQRSHLLKDSGASEEGTR